MARGYGTGGSEQQQNKHTRQHANAGSTAGPRAQDQRAAASFGVRECCEAMFVWVDIDPPSLHARHLENTKCTHHERPQAHALALAKKGDGDRAAGLACICT